MAAQLILMNGPVWRDEFSCSARDQLLAGTDSR